MALRTAIIDAQEASASTQITTGLGWPPVSEQYLASASSIATIAGPSGSSPTGSYPVVPAVFPTDLIEADNANQSPENRIARYAESRTDTLRSILNELINVANLIQFYFVDRDGVESSSGMRQNLDMNFKKIINVASATAAEDLVTLEQVTAVSNELAELVQIVANDLVKLDGSQTLLASINMGGNRVINAGSTGEGYGSVPDSSSIIKQKADQRLASGMSSALQPKSEPASFTSPFSIGGNRIVNLRTVSGNPSQPPQSHFGVTLQDLNNEIEVVQNKRTLYVGSIFAFAGISGLTPAGWLVCDGRFVDRLVYPDLFAALTEWLLHIPGGVTPMQFKLPDLRGRAVVSLGGGNGAGAAQDMAVAFGEERVQLSYLTLPSHSHTFQDITHVTHQNSGTISGTQLNFSGAGLHWTYGEETQDDDGAPRKTSFASPYGFNPSWNELSGPHQNCQPSAAITWIIKT